MKHEMFLNSSYLIKITPTRCKIDWLINPTKQTKPFKGILADNLPNQKEFYPVQVKCKLLIIRLAWMRLHIMNINDELIFCIMMFIRSRSNLLLTNGNQILSSLVMVHKAMPNFFLNCQPRNPAMWHVLHYEWRI